MKTVDYLIANYFHILSIQTHKVWEYNNDDTSLKDTDKMLYLERLNNNGHI